MTDPQFELVTPFVLVKSAGGPYDDKSFSSGYRLGRMDMSFEISAQLHSLPRAYTFAHEEKTQVDLIAMKHGFTVEFEDYDEYWTIARFDYAEEEEL